MKKIKERISKWMSMDQWKGIKMKIDETFEDASNRIYQNTVLVLLAYLLIACVFATLSYCTGYSDSKLQNQIHDLRNDVADMNVKLIYESEARVVLDKIARNQGRRIARLETACKAQRNEIYRLVEATKKSSQ